MSGYHYDLTGERVDHDEPIASVIRLPYVTSRGHDCLDGWLPGEDDEGRPMVCPLCRPTSAQRIRTQRERWGA